MDFISSRALTPAEVLPAEATIEQPSRARRTRCLRAADTARIRLAAMLTRVGQEESLTDSPQDSPEEAVGHESHRGCRTDSGCQIHRQYTPQSPPGRDEPGFSCEAKTRQGPCCSRCTAARTAYSHTLATSVAPRDWKSRSLSPIGTVAEAGSQQPGMCLLTRSPSSSMSPTPLSSRRGSRAASDPRRSLYCPIAT